MIRDTSLLAWSGIQENLGRARENVLSALRLIQPASNMELARELGWSINRVTPRIKELRDRGIVFDSGRRECDVTGRMVHAWGVRL